MNEILEKDVAVDGPDKTYKFDPWIGKIP